jgi:5-methylcytosine-specific restriction endonuclease McrA
MAVSKSIRFEIFARDTFTCQYCGRRPPDVVLELDHIHPVSKGGSDEVINLITSCYDCNRRADKETGVIQ